MRKIIFASAAALMMTAPALADDDWWYEVERKLRHFAEINGTHAGIFDACGDGGSSYSRDTENMLATLVNGEQTKRLMLAHNVARFDARYRYEGECGKLDQGEMDEDHAKATTLLLEVTEIVSRVRSENEESN